MIDTNYNMVSHFLSSYDNDAIILQRVADFFDPRDMVHCECVCKLWRTFCEDQGIWMQLSLREGVPLVGGRNRNRRKDFQTLYPITISGARISRTLGKVEEEIPFISEVFISKLNVPDPFEEGKLMKDTWVFVVDPTQFKRIAGDQTPLDLDIKKNLIEVPDNQVQSGKELIIPFSLKNFTTICSYPLKGREHMPVFSKYCYSNVFDQCGACSEKANVYFMRRCIAEESRNLTYAEQEKLVKGFGFAITPLRVRALFNAIVILESGTCPDSQSIHALCPDVIRRGTNNYHAGIGGFLPSSGVRVNRYGSIPSSSIGAAPSVSAAVLL